ncbi:hypothetical protein B0H66DRAFT_180834 [Apodospora peruviana]|uniref:Uncharacterized protein n=1 Tax=Apodospora peruviana TaxID=516989 RepID=A0AAE0IAY7_9PEZI|nr:hypothetical protein B0H66DRAFT_180834 [Apodospora peruviana]
MRSTKMNKRSFSPTMPSNKIPVQEKPARKRHKENEIDIDTTRGLCGACSAVFDDRAEPPRLNYLESGVSEKYLESDVFRRYRRNRSKYLNHHWNLRLLNESSRRGCKLCTLLLQALAYEKYTSPVGFCSRDWGRPHEKSEGELWRHDIDSGGGALEIHFAHEWIPPKTLSGQLEPFESNDRLPKLAAHYVYQHQTTPDDVSSVMDQARNTIATTRHWFERCESGHDSCRRETLNKFAPTRLIKISPGRAITSSFPNHFKGLFITPPSAIAGVT